MQIYSPQLLSTTKPVETKVIRNWRIKHKWIIVRRRFRSTREGCSKGVYRSLLSIPFYQRYSRPMSAETTIAFQACNHSGIVGGISILTRQRVPLHTRQFPWRVLTNEKIHRSFDEPLEKQTSKFRHLEWSGKARTKGKRVNETRTVSAGRVAWTTTMESRFENITWARPRELCSPGISLMDE